MKAKYECEPEIGKGEEYEMNANELNTLKQEVKNLYNKSWNNNNKVKNRPYVFISYSHEKTDMEQVYRFVKKLLEHNVNISIDMEYSGKNDSWVTLMTNEVANRNCKAMVTFFSKNYVRSYPALLELLYRYSEEVRFQHRWKNGRRRRREEQIHMIPISLMGNHAISKFLDNEIDEDAGRQTRTPFENEPSDREEDCLIDGLQGLEMLEKSANSRIPVNYMRFKDLLQVVEDVPCLIRDLVVEKEAIFDNCNLVTEFDDILQILEEYGVVNQETSTVGLNEVQAEFGEAQPSEKKLEKETVGKETEEESENVSTAEEELPNILTLEQFERVKAVQIGEEIYNVSAPKNAYVRILLSAAQAGMRIPEYEEGLRQGYYEAEGRKILATANFDVVLRAPRFKRMFTLYDKEVSGAKDSGEFQEIFPSEMPEIPVNADEEKAVTSTKKPSVLNSALNKKDTNKNKNKQTPNQISNSISGQMLQQPIEEFRTTFRAALAANKAAFQKKGENKKTPPIGFESIVLVIPDCGGDIRIRNQKWKPLFSTMLDVFYEKAGESFFDACVAEAKKSGNAEPYVIEADAFDSQISDTNKKHYQPVRGRYWFRNWYAVDGMIDEMIKWMKRYNRYLEKNSTQTYTLADYFVEYKPEDEFLVYFGVGE